MFSRLSILVVAPLLASACVNTVSIDAEDEVSFSNLEVSIPVGDNPVNRVRFRASRAQGDFDQSIDDDERIRVENEDIDGSTEVDGELDLDYYSVAIGYDDRFEKSEGVRTSMYFGISQTRFDLSVSSGSQRLSTSDETTELYFQLGLYAGVAKSLDFGLVWAASLGQEFSGISEIDLLLEYQLNEHVRLTGGYRWLTYEYGLADDESNIEVDFRGPLLGLHIPF